MSPDSDRFKNMVENSQDWFWEFDENADFTYASPRIKDLLGYEPEEIIGLNAFDLMASEEAERVHKYFDPIAKRYQPFSCLENINLHKDGHEVIIESSGTPIFDEDGNFKGYRGIDRDVTRQRQLETDFRHVFSEMIDAFALHEIICDEAGTPIDYRFLNVNPAFEKITGLKAVDVIGKTVLEVMPGTESHWIKTYGDVALNGKTVHFDHYSGEIDRHFEVKAYSPRPGQFACIFLDITRQKNTEQALKESEERFRSAFVTIPDPVVIAKLSDGAIVDVNPAFEFETGIKRIEAIGHNSADLNLWEDEGNRQAFREELIRNGAIINQEVNFRTQGDKVRPCKLSAKVFHLNDEPYILIIVRDITDEKMAERALIETDQIKSEFISTAAHELRTPLTAIMGFAEILSDPKTGRDFSDEQRTTFIKKIFDRSESLKKMIDDLLDISRIERGQPLRMHFENVHIQDVISVSVDSFSDQFTNREFELEISEATKSIPLAIDRHRILQVLENLLSNAVKYSNEGSAITIKAEAINNEVAVSICDTGIGMTEEEARRVFDKFYRADTSETAISGLGLGMSIAKQIIEAHHGHIQVESAKGVGSTFTFFLPTAN